ncbi:uncharacterized protein N7498_009061 [Penicillium cinerascens]|uniref:Uncharacterized protein n=1 Tax=Penicillium cinerascens TaxID=70096 RepID=A0A9W9MB98_9EURO|nr:uncharacterized protein N7498_009061 [Penicillium cinerascens]KAJ5195623.1 hypothetical protein N7498_009061 [Penicillium cinerascens]
MMANHPTLRHQCDPDVTLDVMTLQPSPAAIAMSFAASFYRDAQACKGTQELARVHRAYRDKILALNKLAANIAAAFRPLLRNSLPPSDDNGNDARQWDEFDALAQKFQNSRDRESQHLRHQSGIIAIWGPDIFQHYGWQALPLDLMRKLHDLALLISRWEDVVHLLNSRMLARHELSVLRGNNYAHRIGQHSTGSKVQDPWSPVERKDILAALDWARQKAASAEAREHIQNLKDSTRSINGTPIKDFWLKRDRYGMVIPVMADDALSHAVLSDRPAKRLKLSTTGAFRPLFPDVPGTPTPLGYQSLSRTRDTSRDVSSRSTSVGFGEEHGIDDDTDNSEGGPHAGVGSVGSFDSTGLRTKEGDHDQEQSTRTVDSQASESEDGHGEKATGAGEEPVRRQMETEAEGQTAKGDVTAGKEADREGVDERGTEEEEIEEVETDVETDGASGRGSGKDDFGETGMAGEVTEQETLRPHVERQQAKGAERFRNAMRAGGTGTVMIVVAESPLYEAENGKVAQGQVNTSQANDVPGVNATSTAGDVEGGPDLEAERMEVEVHAEEEDEEGGREIPDEWDKDELLGIELESETETEMRKVREGVEGDEEAEVREEEEEGEDEEDEANRGSAEAHIQLSDASKAIGPVSSTDTSMNLTALTAQEGSKQFASDVLPHGGTNAAQIREADGSSLKRNANNRAATSRGARQGTDPETLRNGGDSTRILASSAQISRSSTLFQHNRADVESASAIQTRQDLYGNSESDLFTVVFPRTPVESEFRLQEIPSEVNTGVNSSHSSARAPNPSTAFFLNSTDSEQCPTPVPASFETDRLPHNTGGTQTESHTLSGTLLESIQSRHSTTVQRLVQEASRPHPEPSIMHQRRLQLDWLRPQRWASIYAEPEDLLGKSSASSEEADIWYLSWDRFRRYADSGYVFRCPVVVKQTFLDSGMYNLEEYMEMLWQRFPEQSVDVQNSQTGVCSPMTIPDYCLAVSKLDLTSSDAIAPVSNAINLGRIARADEPLLTRLTRFRLLSTLIDRANGMIGKRLHGKPADIENYLHFNLFAFSGAFSRSQMDFSVGTWVRCLLGRQVWMIAPNMDADDWQSFAEKGCHWSPRGKGRIVILEQDDVLLMPPALRVVHSVFTPEPCLLEGGVLWDECCIPEILEGLAWIAKNQTCTNEAISNPLPELINTLEQWFDENHAHLLEEQQVSQYQDAIKAGIATLRALSYDCYNGYKAPGSCRCMRHER